ncbi:MAG: SRPBCC family protein [Vicinamibacterales bacterium]
MTSTAEAPDVPVSRRVTVKTTITRAFEVFTDGLDTWWPRTHHIGKSPMKRAIIEPFTGGRCYSDQIDGTDCQWGTVLAWEPPQRLVIAWQITHEWGFEPDLAKASEVEILFTPQRDGSTRIDLEHRHFGRLGAGAAAMRTAVSSKGGWGTLLESFAERAEHAE